MNNRIKELRLQAGLTLAKLGKAAGTDASTISKLEKGQTRLSDDWKRRIAPALNVKPFQLMSDAPLVSVPAGTDFPTNAHQINDSELSERKEKPTAMPRNTQHKTGHSEMTMMSDPPRVDPVPVKGTAIAALAEGPFPEGGFNLKAPMDFVERPPALAAMPSGYAIYIAGESMEPEHRPGDLRFVVPRSPKKGDTALIYVKDYKTSEVRAYIKIYQGMDEHFVVTIQHNPPAKIRFHADTITMMHKVLTISEMYGR